MGEFAKELDSFLCPFLLSFSGKSKECPLKEFDDPEFDLERLPSFNQSGSRLITQEDFIDRMEKYAAKKEYEFKLDLDSADKLKAQDRKMFKELNADLVLDSFVFMAPYTGLLLFCKIFSQFIQADKNLLEVNKADSRAFTPIYIGSERIGLMLKLQKLALQYQTGVKIDETFGGIPKNKMDREHLFQKLLLENPSNEFLNSIVTPNLRVKSEKMKGDILSLTEIELLRYYYSQAVKRAGTLAAAAKRVGKKSHQFRYSYYKVFEGISADIRSNYDPWIADHESKSS